MSYRASCENSDEISKSVEKKLEDKTLSKEDEVFYKQRLIINKGIVAVLSIGAHTESELLELVDRIDDALHATKAAIESGFLPGGGIALARAGINLLEESKEESLLDNTVSKIVSDACMSPLKKILQNGDKPVDYIIEMIKNNRDWNYGYDVRTESYVDMIDEGIIDPQKVTATAISNAVSVCNSLISVGCIVLNSNDGHGGVQLVQLSDDMY